MFIPFSSFKDFDIFEVETTFLVTRRCHMTMKSTISIVRVQMACSWVVKSFVECANGLANIGRARPTFPTWYIINYHWFARLWEGVFIVKEVGNSKSSMENLRWFTKFSIKYFHKLNMLHNWYLFIYVSILNP